MKRSLAVLTTLTLFIAVSMAGASAIPGGLPNDDRVNAQVMVVPSWDYKFTLLATSEPGEPQPCGNIGSTVWYRVTPDFNGVLTISTKYSDYDTVVAVYGADSPNTALGCDDDSGYGTTSYLELDVQSGLTYEIQAGGYLSAVGNLEIAIENASPPAPPANDSFTNATPIVETPFHHDFDHRGATHEQDEPSSCGAKESTWYSYTPASDQELVLSAYGSGFQPILVLYSHDRFPTYTACDDGSYYYHSARLRFTVEGGQTYLFQLARRAGYSGGLGYLSLTIPESPPVEPDPEPTPTPEATNIHSMPFGDERTTVKESETGPKPCGDIGSSVWYRWTADADRSLVVDTAGSEFDTVVAMYESTNLSRALGCNNNLDTKQARLEFTALQGHTYYIQIGGVENARGLLRLAVTEAHPGFPEETWPEIDSATIRPGARLYTEGRGWCTANFVFRGTGLRQGRLYIATAGHCTNMATGAAVHLPSNDDLVYATKEFGPVIGHVAYSSWDEMGVFSGDCIAGVSQTCRTYNPEGGDLANDFSLIEIRSEARNTVHPAVFYYGGPTGIVDLSQVSIGDRVLSFGNSVLRPGPEQLDHREGWIKDINAPYKVYVRSVNVGVWGDSGSDALLEDGRALGIVVTINLDGTNGISSLSKVLATAKALGWDVSLQTWELINGPQIPRIPIVP